MMPDGPTIKLAGFAERIKVVTKKISGQGQGAQLH
jgi:hypothetical protein